MPSIRARDDQRDRRTIDDVDEHSGCAFEVMASVAVSAADSLDLDERAVRDLARAGEPRDRRGEGLHLVGGAELEDRVRDVAGEEDEEGRDADERDEQRGPRSRIAHRAVPYRLFGREKTDETRNMNVEKHAMPTSTLVGVPSSPRSCRASATYPVAMAIAM